MIFANHAHLFPAAIREDGSIDSLIRVLDACEINKAIAFAPFPSQVAELGIQPNHWLADTLSTVDRVSGFGVLDIRAKNLTKQAEEIAALGFRGVKLHPAFQKFNILDDELMEFYAAAQERGLFLSFHTGVHWHRIKDYHPLLFDEVAYHYPGLKFSMEHVGGYSFFGDAMAVMVNNQKHGQEYSNVFAGITSVFDKQKDPAWYLGEERVLEIISMAGINQLLFGLDFPYNRADQIQAAIDRIRALPIEEEDKQKILGGNLSAVLQQ